MPFVLPLIIMFKTRSCARACVCVSVCVCEVCKMCVVPWCLILSANQLHPPAALFLLCSCSLLALFLLCSCSFLALWLLFLWVWGKRAASPSLWCFSSPAPPSFYSSTFCFPVRKLFGKTPPSIIAGAFYTPVPDKGAGGISLSPM